MGFGDRLKKAFGFGKKKDEESRPQDKPGDDESERIIDKIDSFQDENQDNCDDSEDTRNFRYLEGLIKSGAKEIVLDSDITFADGEESQYRNGIRIDAEDVVIDGNNYSIDAKGKARIFDLSSRLTLKNITLKNASGIDGGAVYTRPGSLLNTSNVLFKDNHANENGGAIFNRGMINLHGTNFTGNSTDEGDGGAIYNKKGSTCFAFSCQFRKNTSNNKAGAIFSLGKTELMKCSFIANTSKDGENVIFCEGEDDLKAEDCLFKDNITAKRENKYGLAERPDDDKTDEKWKTCKNCGRKISKASKKCPYCGVGGKDKTFKYLDELIHSGAKEIVLDSSIALSDGEESQYGEGIKLDEDELVIDANGYAIDAKGKARIFHCTAKNVTIKNVTLKNGYAQRRGGAIYNEGDGLTILDSAIIENISKRGIGGAIYNEGSGLKISDSIVNKNTSHGGGGAISNHGARLSISNCEFCENASNHDGGAIYNGGDGLTITATAFTKNASDMRGGAIYSDGAKLSILKSAFDENTTKYNGGAIFNGNPYEWIITDCRFSKNRTEDGYGGAVYNPKGMLSISNSEFDNNITDKDGGALYNDGCELSISDSSFRKNSSDRAGGAIYNNEGSVMCVANSTLSSNTAKGGGGAIYNLDSALSVLDSTFDANGAEYDGGAIKSSGILSIADSTFSKNRADRFGGAIYSRWREVDISDSSLQNAFQDDCSELDIAKSLFNHNTANQDGGAIYNELGTLTIMDSEFSENTAKNDCGAIYANENDLKVENCRFDENKPDDFGMVRNFKYLDYQIHSGEKFIELDSDITLSNNEGSSYWQGIKLDVDNITINGNGHTIDAGGNRPIFYCTAKNVRIENVTLKNGHSRHGGAIQNSGELTIAKSVIAENTAYECCGAIFNQGELAIDASCFRSNSSEEVGAIYNEGELNIENSTFESNSAKKSGVIRNLKICSITNCEISMNDSEDHIVLNEDFLEIRNTVFKDNTSKNIVYHKGDSHLGIFFNKFLNNTIVTSAVNNAGKSCIIDRSVFNSIFTKKNPRNIVNKADLTLNMIKIENEGKTILNMANKGHIRIKEAYPDIESKISGKGTVEYAGASFTDEKFDFGYLDNEVHKGDVKEIVLKGDIRFENYERDFYEGGIELDIDGLVIDGAGHTIDGANKSRIFTVSAKNITLKNIKFTNGRSHKSYFNPFNSNGGALKVNRCAELTIENCEFAGNNSEEHGAAIDNNGELSIAESKFTENTSKLNGGAIDNSGELSIMNSSIDLNSSEEGTGGAINNCGMLNVTDSNFNSNSADGDEAGEGGAICNGGNFVISGCDFKANSAKLQGGAIQNRDKLTITGSTLNENTAKLCGGAVNNEGNLTVADSTLSQNTAESGSGGAIRNAGESIIEESALCQNRADGKSGAGGAIDNSGDLKVFNSQFNDNAATLSGGAINNDNALLVVKTMLNRNNADCGGAIRNTCKSRIEESVLCENDVSGNSSAGGAIYNSGDLSIVTSKINNHATKGSMIKNNGGNLSVEDSMFADNLTKDGKGVMISNEKGNLTIEKSTFADNDNAIYNMDDLSIADSIFTNNGGSHIIYNYDGKLSIADSAFSNNLIKYGGDVIYNSGDNLTICNSIFSANSSSSVISNYDGKLSIEDSSFSNNASTYKNILINNRAKARLRNFELKNDASSKDDYAGDIYNKGRLVIEGSFTSNQEKTIINNHHVFMHESIMNQVNNLHWVHKLESDENIMNFTFLSQLIQNATDEIKLENDIVLDYSNEENTYIEGIEIGRDNLIIDGGGHRIDAKGLTRIFDVKGKNVTIKNIKLENGYAKDGGAIRNSGGLAIIESCIDGNIASAGGAICSSGELKIFESSLRGNVSEENGGAISSEGILNIEKSALEGNMANRGGAIKSDGELSIYSSSFNENTSKGDGGAINSDGKLNVADSSFTNNTSINDGGAIYITRGELSVLHSSFKENTSKRNGGAIHSTGFYSRKMRLNIADSLFEANACENHGGAIYHGDGDLTISSSTFNKNTSKGNAGAVYGIDGMQDIANSLFIANSAENDGGAIYNADGDLNITDSILKSNVARKDGGAIRNGGTIKFANIIFENNVSPSSRDIYNVGRLFLKEGFSSIETEPITNDGYIFISQKDANKNLNNMGRIIRLKSLEKDQRDFTYLNNLIESGTKEIKLENDICLNIDKNEDETFRTGLKIDKDDLIIDGNGHMIEAQGLARIFYVDAKNITIKNVTLKKGYSSSGGAIVNTTAGELTIIGCDISENIVIGYGGAINNNGELSISDCVFTNNPGGAIRNEQNSKMNIAGSTFNNNTAKRFGGAIYNRLGVSIVKYSTFTDNRSEIGGAICNDMGGLAVASSTFKGNVAEDNGGAIWSQRGRLIVSGSTFKENTSTGGEGGGIWTRGSDAELKYCTAENNIPDDINK